MDTGLNVEVVAFNKKNDVQARLEMLEGILESEQYYSRNIAQAVEKYISLIVELSTRVEELENKAEPPLDEWDSLEGGVPLPDNHPSRKTTND